MEELQPIKAVIHSAGQANQLIANYLSEHLYHENHNLIALFPPQLVQEIATRTIIEAIEFQENNHQIEFSTLGYRVLKTTLNLLYQYSGASARFRLEDSGDLFLTNVAGDSACLLATREVFNEIL